MAAPPSSASSSSNGGVPLFPQSASAAVAHLAATPALALPKAIYKSTASITSAASHVSDFMLQPATSSATSLVTLLCTCCLEERQKEVLFLLPDLFRSNSRSPYICQDCHSYITSLYVATGISKLPLQAWKFQTDTPTNYYDLARESVGDLFADIREKDEIFRLLPFTPKLAIDLIARGVNTLEIAKATVLILDVSGYTALAEELAGNFGEGNVIGQASGAEALVNDGLNLYFKDLVNTVHEYGGDVIKFAGDALICLFCTNDYGCEDSSVISAARNAVMCATVAAHTKTHVVAVDAMKTKELTCHCGLATGKVIAWSVGGTDRKEILLTGKTLQDAGNALDRAASRSVVIDHTSYMLVSDVVVTHILASASEESSTPNPPQPLDKARKLLGNPDPSTLPRKSITATAGFFAIECVTVNAFSAIAERFSMMTQLKNVNPSAVKAFLSRHVPKPARDLSIVNEMRRVTTVFTKLSNVGLVDTAVNLEDLFRDCQFIVSSLGGMVRQFIVDDKGCVLISVYGVASYADMDDARRALTAAVKLAHELSVPAASGVATGIVYVGVVGWPGRRCEFAIVGDSVNLAARLMSLASKSGERQTRCDEATAVGSSDRIALTELDSVMLKGKSKPIKVFSPSITRTTSSQVAVVKSSKSTVALLEKHAEVKDNFFGRQPEQKEIKRYIAELLGRESQSAVTFTKNILFIQGASGLGKTRMLSWIQHEMSTTNVLCVRLLSSSDLAGIVEQIAVLAIGAEYEEDPESIIDHVQQAMLEKLSARQSGATNSSLMANILITQAARPPILSVSYENTPLLGKNRRLVQRSISLSSATMPPPPLSPMAMFSKHNPLHNYSSLSAQDDISLIGEGGSERAVNFESSTLKGITGGAVSHDYILDALFGNNNNNSSMLAAASAQSLSSMDGNLKNELLEYLLISFMHDVVAKRPHVLLLVDNSDRLADGAAKAVLRLVQEINGIGVVATSNSDDGRFNAGRQRTFIELEPMTDDDVMKVVKMRFGFEDCPIPVWSCILSGSQGNPLHACEWFRALMTQQFIMKTGPGTYSLSPTKTDDDLTMVTPLEGSILYSFDTTLTLLEKDVLRKCTVVCSDTVGSGVTLPVLRSMMMEENISDEAFDEQMINALNKLSVSSSAERTDAYLTRITDNPGKPFYDKFIFSNEIVRSVLYRTMTFAERSKLHLKVAVWLQENGGWDIAIFSLTTFHLLSAGEKRQAFDYLRSISSLLLKSGTFGDAVTFLKQALDVGSALRSNDAIGERDVFEVQAALILAQLSSIGKIREPDTVMKWLNETQSRLEQQTADASTQVPSKPRSIIGAGLAYLRRTVWQPATSLFAIPGSPDGDGLLEQVRSICVIKIWCSIAFTGNADDLEHGFANLIGTFAFHYYPTQRLFLHLLSSALTPPLRRARATKLDIGMLERTADVAMQLGTPEVVGLGLFATSLSLLFMAKPFAAERIARDSFSRLKDAIFSSTSKSMFVSGAPGLHSLQLIAISQSFCGALFGALNSVNRVYETAKRLDVGKFLAWSECSAVLLKFKLDGVPFGRDGTAAGNRTTVEVAKPIFDWQSLSDVDGFVARAGIAFGSKQECGWFTCTGDMLRALRERRFEWWLGDCFEAALCCGLSKHAAWTGALLDEFLEYSKTTLQVALPIAYRIKSLWHAQRGEYVLAVKCITRARKEARNMNLLFEAQLCNLILVSLYQDSLADDKVSVESFEVYGCSAEFERNMKATLAEWISTTDSAGNQSQQHPSAWSEASKRASKWRGITLCMSM